MHVLGFSLFFQPGGVQDKQLNEFIQVLNVEYFYQLLVAAHSNTGQVMIFLFLAHFSKILMQKKL